ncbi:MAG: SLOG family protein [Lachnospirales bacterium]
MDKVCAFTGHRKLPKDKIINITTAIEIAIDRAINDGYKHFIAGGATGVDTIAAKIVTEKIDHDESISLSLYLPYENFVNKTDLAYFQPYCKEIKSVAKSFNMANYMIRNKMMVDASSRIICVYKPGLKSGTLNTINYAKERNIELVLINCDDIPLD